MPNVRIADPAFNAQRTVELAGRASDQHAALVVFPELGLSGYAIDDLLHQQSLTDAVLEAIAAVLAASRFARAGDRRRSAAGDRARAVQHGRRDPPREGSRRGAQELPARVPRVLREAPVPGCTRRRSTGRSRCWAKTVPFGADLLFFSAADLPPLTVHVEVCEDLWAPIPPSTYGALAGATVLANLSASNITIGKADYRHSAVRGAFGPDDLGLRLHRGRPRRVDDRPGVGRAGHDLRERRPARRVRALRRRGAAIFADIDLDRIMSDRARTSSFGDSIGDYRERAAAMRGFDFELGVPSGAVALAADLERFPYRPVRPSDSKRALRGGLQHPGARPGDAAAGHRDREGRDRRVRRTGLDPRADRRRSGDGPARPSARNVLGYTMPGFATSALTRETRAR